MKFETTPEAGTITMRGGIGDFENHISANDFLDWWNWRLRESHQCQ